MDGKLKEKIRVPIIADGEPVATLEGWREGNKCFWQLIDPVLQPPRAIIPKTSINPTSTRSRWEMVKILYDELEIDGLTKEEIRIYVDELSRRLIELEENESPPERVVFLSKFTPRPFTERIINNLGGRIFYDPKTGIIWGYDAELGIWRDVEPDVRRALRTEVLGEEQLRTFYVNEVLNDLKDLTARERPPEPPWWLICVKNGVFDLKAGKLLPHSPDYFFLNRIPHALRSEVTDCPKIDELFAEWVNDKRVLYELCTYCLIRAYPYQKIFFIYGSGNNGKGTFASLLRRFLGAENVSGIGLDDLVNSPFAAAHLFRKLANISGEVNVSTLAKTDILKRLTGGDIITAQEKYKPMFEFVNYAKLIFLTNTIPKTPDRTVGFYRRLYFVEFPNTFEGREKAFIIDELPEKEFEGLLFRSLTEILPAMMRREFRFSDDPQAEELMKMHEKLSNPLIAFIERYFEEDADGHIPKWVFRELFQQWCRKRGHRVWSEREIGLEMRNLGYETKNKTYTAEEVKFWHGVVGQDSAHMKERRWWSYAGLRLRVQLVQDVQDVSKSHIYNKEFLRQAEQAEQVEHQHTTQADLANKVAGALQELQRLYGNNGISASEIAAHLGLGSEVKRIEALLEEWARKGIVWKPEVKIRRYVWIGR